MFRLYDVYSFQVIPVLGEVIAGDWKSYQYLVESIRQFPSQVQNFYSLQQRPYSWNPGDFCCILLCVLGGVQGDDRRCWFSEGDLWKSNIRHCSHSFWLQTVTPLRSWSVNQSHPVKRLEPKDNVVSETSTTSPLKAVCLGLMFWCDQSQSERNKLLSLYCSFPLGLLQAFSQRYLVCTFCLTPTNFSWLCSMWLRKTSTKTQFWSVFVASLPVLPSRGIMNH